MGTRLVTELFLPDRKLPNKNFRISKGGIPKYPIN
ncbi:hypothetical protein LEMLEM_LOCUS7558 [Lemmus lemmus]